MPASSNDTLDRRPRYLCADEAGRELKDVISAIGHWGQRWAREIESEDLDPGWLVWAMHRRIDTAAMPSGGVVIEIRFTDAPVDHRLFWLVCRHPQVEVCVKRPDFPLTSQWSPTFAV